MFKKNDFDNLNTSEHSNVNVMVNMRNIPQLVDVYAKATTYHISTETTPRVKIYILVTEVGCSLN